ncbi:uncharacterized protein LOC141909862 [Tubulanus polymorphus]|uniref:uncharacterized protein LOC141909859 n=1 Tax=Tubulanus polymorphus TaxID=672921 RepID=UPI003DA27093
MKLLLAVLVFMALSSAALSCRCRQRTLKYKFCTSKYVLKAKILSKERTPGNVNAATVFYKIDAEKYYKPADAMEANPLTVVSTAATGSLCGYPGLKKGETHILFVYTYKGTPRLGSCSQPYGVTEADIKDIDCSTQTGMENGMIREVMPIDFDEQLVKP